MTQFNILLESLLILVALCASAIWLRHRGVIARSEQAVFGRLMTDFALPAVILLSLSRAPFSAHAILPTLLIFLATILTMVPAWLIGKAMRLERPVMGSLILVSAFGGSSTLGLSLIRRIFGDNAVVMRDSVLMGEYGVLLPVFTIGVAIAIYFGREDHNEVSLWEAFKPFFMSPIFAAMVAGTVISLIGLSPHSTVVRLFENFLHVAGRPLILLVAFSIGLSLGPIPIRRLAMLIVVVAGLKLLFEPFLAWAMALPLHLPKFEIELLVLQAAMPSGAISAVIAARYGCDGPTASALVVATAVLSLISLPLVLFLGS